MHRLKAYSALLVRPSLSILEGGYSRAGRPRVPDEYDEYYWGMDPWDRGYDRRRPPGRDDRVLDAVNQNTRLLREIQRTTNTTLRLTRDIHRWVEEMWEGDRRR